MTQEGKHLAHMEKAPRPGADTVSRQPERHNMATDIPSEVRRIIKEQLDVDEASIKPESSFIDDLGADSLGLVELVLAFEEAFKVNIPDEVTEKIRTVGDAIQYIEQHSMAA
jgi:acyl carrier protein